jgi:HAD superfamily phosphatase
LPTKRLLEKLLDFNLKDKIDAVIFDVDGVLIDVRPSYHKAIYETFKHYTGKDLKEEDFTFVKKKAGINNDWESSSVLILMALGYITKEEALQYTTNQTYIQQKIFNNPYFDYNELVDIFEAFYRKFRENEILLLDKSFLKALKKNYKTGIVTGRPKDDLIFSLKLFGIEDIFDFVVDDDYTDDKTKRKPSKEALKYCVDAICKKGGVYIGDTISDIMMTKHYNDSYKPYVYYIHCNFYNEENTALPKEYIYATVKFQKELEDLLL